MELTIYTIYLENLLTDLSKEKVKDWQLESVKGIKAINEWLDNLKDKYGRK